MTDSTRRFTALEKNWRRVASTHTLQDLLHADDPPKSSFRIHLALLGILLIASGLAIFIAATYAIIVAPLLPPPHHWLLAAIYQDKYYHLLLPLTVPVTILAITVNWFSMKIFKHNT